MGALSQIRLPEEKGGGSNRVRITKKFNRIAIEFISKLGRRLNLTPQQQQYLNKINAMGLDNSSMPLTMFASFATHHKLNELVSKKMDVKLAYLNDFGIFQDMSNKSKLSCISYIEKLHKLNSQHKAECDEEGHQSSPMEKAMGFIPMLMQNMDRDLIQNVMVSLPGYVQSSFKQNNVNCKAFCNVLEDIVMRVLCSDPKLAQYKPMVLAFLPKVKEVLKKQLFTESKDSVGLD